MMTSYTAVIKLDNIYDWNKNSILERNSDDSMVAPTSWMHSIVFNDFIIFLHGIFLESCHIYGVNDTSATTGLVLSLRVQLLLIHII